MWEKAVEADIVGSFQRLEEVLYQDRVEIHCLSLSLKRETCEHLETLQNIFLS
jgi:hypothetical protein